MTELFTVMNILYIVTGGLFFAGAGAVMFAFALSYISQKVAMWVDVRKIVIHRNALVEEVKTLKIQIGTIEGLLAANEDKEKQVIAPTEIGVQSVPIGAP